MMTFVVPSALAACAVLTDEPDNQTILRSLPLIDMQLKLKEGRPADDDDDDDDTETDTPIENEPVMANGAAAAPVPAACDDTTAAAAVQAAALCQPAPSDAELRRELRSLVDSLVEEESTQVVR